MGHWRYADVRGSYQGERALELAVAASGKRNLFHDDVLLCLSERERPLRCPPLVVERRLVLTIIPSGWPQLAGEAAQEWVSEPMPQLAVRARWVRRRRLNEAITRAVATDFFARVHEELHAAAEQQSEAKSRCVAGPWGANSRSRFALAAFRSR
jgi:hypothetical protein